MLTLPSQVHTALDRLTAAGWEAYVVGGAVRDALRGCAAGDWDITTNAEPAQVERVFAGERLIETGLRHGTVTVLLDGLPLEITTYRVDGDYTDHRRPDAVRFTRSLREDLLRRDFTMNALAYHPRTGLVDVCGGAEDIARGVVRCVGEPDRRFQEDGLRILRALRFSSVQQRRPAQHRLRRDVLHNRGRVQPDVPVMVRVVLLEAEHRPQLRDRDGQHIGKFPQHCVHVLPAEELCQLAAHALRREILQQRAIAMDGRCRGRRCTMAASRRAFPSGRMVSAIFTATRPRAPSWRRAFSRACALTRPGARASRSSSAITTCPSRRRQSPSGG